MRINDLFDKIYLINMDKDKDRLEHMLNRFKEWSIEDYQRIQGGGVFTEIPEGICRNFSYDTPGYALGSADCRHSHLAAIRDANIH